MSEPACCFYHLFLLLCISLLLSLALASFITAEEADLCWGHHYTCRPTSKQGHHTDVVLLAFQSEPLDNALQPLQNLRENASSILAFQIHIMR